jgi:hypothetical protein
MPYTAHPPSRWAPILAGLLSPHLFLLACLPGLHALGIAGPFTLRLGAYHALCEAVGALARAARYSRARASRLQLPS